MSRPSHTALHEAAHAVVAYILGYKVKEIVVNPDGTGYCTIFYRIGRHKECPITMVNILLAGHEAEVLWCRRKLTEMPSGDLRMIAGLGVSWTGINIQRDPLRKFLRRWKKTIWEVAAMADKGRIAGRHFHSFMRTACACRPGIPKMCTIKSLK